MKKVAFAAFVAVAFASSGVYAENPNNVGCGLGTTIWEGQTGTGPQILAATTNGTSGNQTFGITSATSGCARGGEVQRPDKMAAFIGPNIDRLAQDMSRGEGETLASLAHVMGIENQDRAAFYALTQRNFDRIMPTDTVTAQEVVVSINAVMSEDVTLSRYVAS
ncbi:MAG: DUF3015 domain-containing protein [Hyphomicrobiales bacterium]|nr:DUF3015 domain-containing protein [Hyphomicrobiales bacterium]